MFTRMSSYLRLHSSLVVEVLMVWCRGLDLITCSNNFSFLLVLFNLMIHTKLTIVGMSLVYYKMLAVADMRYTNALRD